MQKELAMFGNLSQFPLGGKLSFKVMAFNVSSFFFAFYQPKEKPAEKVLCSSGPYRNS